MSRRSRSPPEDEQQISTSDITFEMFLSLPYEIQNLILQEAGYGSLANLLSTSKSVSSRLRENKKINFTYFEENKDYQRSKYKRFYNGVRKGKILTTPNLAGSTLTNKQISEKIKVVSCFNYQLKHLPPLPNCENLYCDSNELTSLPDLPNCETLHCNNNQLTFLPELPNCKTLSCSKNQLTSLPELPNCISLDCQMNKITCLPNLPKIISIRTIYNPLPKSLLINHLNVDRKGLNELIEGYCKK
jgi:hypothetical protein